MNKTPAFHEAWIPRPAQVAPLKLRLLKILLFFTLLAGAVILYPKFQEFRDRGQPAVVAAPSEAKDSEFSRAEASTATSCSSAPACSTSGP